VQSGSTTTIIKLNKTIDLDVGETYEIGIKNGINDEIEVRTVISSPGQTDEIEVSAPFTFQPAEFDIWNCGIEGYRSKKYRILSLDKQNVVSIQAVEYHEEAYDYTGIQTPEDNFTYLTLEIPSVTDLTAEERVVRLGSGEISVSINTSFTKPPTGARWVKKVNRFQIYLSDNNGASWDYIGDTDKESYVITRPFTVGTRYIVAVVSVTDVGEAKVPANSPKIAVVIEGWKSSPVNISGLTYTFEDEIKLTWDIAVDTDLAGYEIRTEDDNWGLDTPSLVWSGKAETYTIVRPTARSGIIYFVRAKNSSGVYSDVSAQVTPVNAPPTALALTYLNVFQKAYLMWQDSTDADLVEYEVWINNTSTFVGIERVTERMVTKAQGTSATILVEYGPSFFRIRGVDKFGPGDWSNVVEVAKVPIVTEDIGDGAVNSRALGEDSVTANKIQAGSIQAGHISALAVTAEKMNVACLSAITANLGTVTAGTMIGTTIKTSDELHRLEMTNAGLFAYNEAGVNTVKLEQGQMCLISAVCSDFYSYLDHGSLKFRHPYGEVPYLKRLCSGDAVTGSTVTLCQWYEQPQVTVSIKRLTTYDVANCVDSQEVCVYADNTRFYDNGAGDFGWRFDIHAELKLSGGVRDECFYDTAFNFVQTTLGATCSVLVKEQFLLFRHGASPENYCYGHSCFEVRYRVQGCAVWCSCEYEYIQPFTTPTELETVGTICQTVGFGCSDTWEITMHENSFTWIDSGVVSGEYCCCLCQCYYPVDCSYGMSFSDTYTIGIGDGGGVSTKYINTICQCLFDYIVALGSWNETEYPVYCSCVNYSSNMHIRGNTCSGSFSVSTVGQYGGAKSICAPWGGGYCFYQMTLYGGNWQNCLIPSVTFSSNSCLHTGPIIGINGDSASATHCYEGTTVDRTICYKQCCVCCCLCEFYYYTWVGASACCNYKKFHSMQEIKGTSCVVDPNGVLNYLAMAYS